MTGAQGIRLAKAYYEIFADNSKLEAGLRKAEMLMRGWQARMSSLGGLSGIGGGIAGAGMGNIFSAVTTGAAGLFGMFGKLRSGADSLANMLARISYAIRHIGVQFLMTGQTLSQFGMKLVFVTMAAVSAGTAFLTMGVRWGAQLYYLSQAFGVSVAALSKFQFAADQSGTDIEHFAKAMQYLAVKIQVIAQEGGRGAEAFKALGLQWRDLVHLSPDQQFIAVAEAIGKIGNAAQRSGIAQQLFGRGMNTEQLIPLLKGGKDGIVGLAREAERLGLTLDGRTGRSLAQITESFKLLWAVVRRVAAEIASAAQPAMEKFGNTIGAMLRPMLNWIRANPQLVTGLAIAASAVGTLALGLFALGTAFKVLGANVMILSTVLQTFAALLPVTFHAVGLLTSALMQGVTFVMAFGQALWGVAQIIGGALIASLAAIPTLLSLIFSGLAGLMALSINVVGIVSGLVSALTVAGEAIVAFLHVAAGIGILGAITTSLAAGFAALVPVLIAALPILAAMAGIVSVTLYVGFSAVLYLLRNLRGIVSALGDAFIWLGREIYKLITPMLDVVKAFGRDIGAAFLGGINGMVAAFPVIVARWAAAFASMRQVALQTIQAVYDAMTAGRWDLVGKILASGFRAAFADIKIAALDTLLSLGQAVQPLIDQAVAFKDAFFDSLVSIKNMFLNVFGEIEKWAIDIGVKIDDAIFGRFDMVGGGAWRPFRQAGFQKGEARKNEIDNEAAARNNALREKQRGREGIPDDEAKAAKERHAQAVKDEAEARRASEDNRKQAEQARQDATDAARRLAEAEKRRDDAKDPEAFKRKAEKLAGIEGGTEHSRRQARLSMIEEFEAAEAEMAKAKAEWIAADNRAGAARDRIEELEAELFAAMKRRADAEAALRNTEVQQNQNPPGKEWVDAQKEAAARERDDAKRALDAAAEEAKRARLQGAKEAAPNPQAIGEAIDIGKRSQSNIGTFNALAVGGLGGGDYQKQTAANTAKAVPLLQNLVRNQRALTFS